MTLFEGRPVVWSNYESLLLPAEKNLPGKEWKRRHREAYQQRRRADDPETIETSRQQSITELQKIKNLLD